MPKRMTRMWKTTHFAEKGNDSQVNPDGLWQRALLLKLCQVLKENGLGDRQWSEAPVEFSKEVNTPTTLS